MANPDGDATKSWIVWNAETSCVSSAPTTGNTRGVNVQKGLNKNLQSRALPPSVASWKCSLKSHWI